MSDIRYQLYYWPLSFRGCFISYLFAYQDTPLLEGATFDQLLELKNQPPAEQAVPFMGPPLLEDHESGRTLSQMPAIVLHVARELGLMPEDPFEQALCLKVLMDCNDVLMEISRFHGAMMWERDTWVRFRAQRLPNWMLIFEESLKRGVIGGEPVNFADISTYALFGNMTRCLPELEPDLIEQAPGIHAHCQMIGAKPSLQNYVLDQERQYQKTYCGGQIEQSIRHMLALDAEQPETN